MIAIDTNVLMGVSSVRIAVFSLLLYQRRLFSIARSF
jgi:hypothetical protein